MANKFPADLSGGMKKRVALARAIVGNPKIILFDEPTTGLDPIMTNTINSLIREIVETMDVTALLLLTTFHLCSRYPIMLLFWPQEEFDGKGRLRN